MNGMNLRDFLIERDIAQASLARRLGMSRSNFSRCVTGQRAWSRHAIKFLPVLLPPDTPTEILIEIRTGKRPTAAPP